MPPNTRRTYHEHLLHWIWSTRHLRLTQIQTRSGQSIRILHPGIHNESDGPDFLGAELKIGPMKWYGDVEIHWSEKDWNRHRHHKDARYNGVILHVVYEAGRVTRPAVLRKDGSSMQTLFLKPYLERPLQQFLTQYNRPDKLPCSGHFSYISPEVFNLQIQKAHKAYFEQKVNTLMTFYDPMLLPSQAWKKVLTLGLFDGLGIIHNRKPMRQLASDLFKHLSSCTSAENLIKKALDISGILQTGETYRSYHWNHKGCRPSNHPKVRIIQGAQCLWFIRNINLKKSLLDRPRTLWDALNAQITTSPGLGKERRSILFGIVWLPSLYIWGQLFVSTRIKKMAYEMWSEHKALLPKSVLSPFHTLSVPSDYYQYKLGAVHQLHSFCNSGKCGRCKVFKNVISS